MEKDKEFKIFVVEAFTRGGEVSRKYLATSKIELVEIWRLLLSAGISVRRYVLVTNPLREEDWE